MVGTDSERAPLNKYAKPAPIGAVMVVGGGIAGMQAALDLADQGFKVYLVEKNSAIGGHMAQLDKTFPTNDCAMCNLSPRLVDVGRHLNIEILTDTDVLDLQGEAGNFTVSLRRRPRYIEPSKCVACGDCATVCPVPLPDLFQEGLTKRKAAYRLYSQAVPAAYAIEKLGTAPCRDACPADQRAQGYIALIAQGRYREALRVIKEDNPFPSVCGRTCHHPCENSCTRALVDQSVGIMTLKRFVVDYALAYGRDQVEPAPRTRPEWIAVIGAGPAGLTAAHDLVKMGYGVTIYEALPVAGGMMRVGIPAHRLPKGVLQQDIDDILALGVILKTNTPVKDPTKLLDQGYHAVCLATGISAQNHSLGIEGEQAEGVISAATFLRKVNLGEPIHIGNHVAVIGGGITALDTAAVARRLGAQQVYLVLDRPRGELPAYQWEMDSTEAEGIQLLERKIPTRVLTVNGKVIGIELAESGKGMTVDASGRRRPKTVPGTEFSIEVDTVIGTMGQFSDLSYLDPQYADLTCDPNTLASNIPGLFLVGGRKTGASYIIDAVALGHRVARSIHSYLQGEPLSSDNLLRPPVAKYSNEQVAQKITSEKIKLSTKVEPTLLSMSERVTSFREVVLGLTEHQAREEAQRCLQCGVCAECLACTYACETNAINHNMLEREEQVQVGAVILAPGYQAYRAEYSQELGYGRYPNVITALQFERLLSASGPTMGHVQRPSDGKEPQRIAFLQCVGSRDQTHDYCSAVCCMYATKEAIIAKEHDPKVDVHIYMMDMRAFSKGYWNYFERARDQYGVKYTRCRASTLHQAPQTHDLLLEYQNENGEHCREKFDLVVLSVGMEISASVRDLGQRLGIQLDEYGFCHTTQFDPVETSRPGIYAVGPFREPKDIPESIVEASGAAAASARLLVNSRWSLTRQREYPKERDVSGEPPRIGVFVCHCGSNIAGFLDVPAVAAYAQTLPNVIHVEDALYACSQDAISTITQRIQEHNLNRVVVASCSPLTHQPLFQESIRAAGLNPFLFEMANIRNQCSWVHSDDWEAATKKAKDLVRMAVARAALLSAQPVVQVPVHQKALVVGGGPAGMTAALHLADSGFPVVLVEKDVELGGNLQRIFSMPSPDNRTATQDPQVVLNQLVNRVQTNPNITIHLNSQVTGTQGFVSNFTSTIQHADGQSNQVLHGVTILATGAREYRGPEYRYGSDPRIITQQEFEALLAGASGVKHVKARSGSERLPKRVVMIQCVGPGERYCSRICCTVALKNALVLKKLKPEAEIVILYQDIRTYGFKERLYKAARECGVVFVRYDNEHKPEVELQPAISLHAWEPILQRPIVLQPDLLVLSMPVVPNPDVHQLAALFKVPVDSDGFFLEAHVKLRPVDFSTPGVFMAGIAHYPKMLDESMIQAQAAAARAARVLSREMLPAGGQVAVVDELICTGCLTCVRVCPFGVPTILASLTGTGNIMGAASIEPAICRGCGLCAAECPARAIQLMHYTDAQMTAKVKALVQPVIELSG